MSQLSSSKRNIKLLVILTLILILAMIFSLVFTPITVQQKPKETFPKIKVPTTSPGYGMKGPTSPPPVK